MSPSRLQVVFKQAPLFGRMRSWPKTSLVCLIVLAASVAWVAVQLWAQYQFAAAGRSLAQDHLDEARRHIGICLQVRPSAPEVHLLAARIERMAGAFPNAEKHLNACKRLEGMTEKTQLEWLLYRAQTGEVADVEGSLWKAVRDENTDTPAILTTLARSYMDQARYHAAQGCLNELLQMEPENVRALHWRGWVRERLDNMHGAADDYGQVVKQDPGRWKVRVRLAEALLTNKNTRDAIQQVEILNRDHADDPDVQMALARCRILQGKAEEAREILEQLLQASPKSAMGLYYRGKVEADASAAEKWFRRALSADPTMVDARFSLYFNLQQQGKQRDASAELKTYYRFVEHAKALKKVLEKLEKAPKDLALLTEAGDLFFQTGNDFLGQQFLYKALESDQTYKRAHTVLGRYFETKKDLAKAAHHLKMGRDHVPPANP